MGETINGIQQNQHDAVSLAQVKSTKPYETFRGKIVSQWSHLVSFLPIPLQIRIDSAIQKGPKAL